MQIYNTLTFKANVTEILQSNVNNLYFPIVKDKIKTVNTMKGVNSINIFKQFYKSLYSPRDIASFQMQGIGKTILYVFLLTLLSVLPTIYYTNSAINTAVKVAEETIKEDLPDFHIENGVLSSLEEQPITINKGNFTFIFDSTGVIDVDNLSKTGDTLAFLQREMVLSAGGEANSVSYSMMAIDLLSKQDIISFIESSDSMMAIILSIFSILIYLFSSGLKFIEISFLAVIGILIKNIVKKKLEYRRLWRMTAYSVTLPTVFFTIMALFQTHVPFGSLINWFVSLTVLLLAIQEVQEPKQTSSID